MTALASSLGAGVQVFFPDAVRESLKPGFGSLDIERVTLQLLPFDRENNVQVARALAFGAPLTINEEGKLIPETFPTTRLSPSIERRVRAIQPVTATVEIRSTLGQDHPQIFCLDPRIDVWEQGYIPHVYTARHQSEQANAICPYPPHYQLFDPKTLDGQYYMVHATAAWVANYLIWKATGQWVGPQASHSSEHIQAQFGDSTCWCRSGRPMALCCGRRPDVSPRQA